MKNMKNNTLTLSQGNQEQISNRLVLGTIAFISLLAFALIVHFANGDPAAIARAMN